MTDLNRAVADVTGMEIDPDTEKLGLKGVYVIKRNPDTGDDIGCYKYHPSTNMAQAD